LLVVVAAIIDPCSAADERFGAEPKTAIARPRGTTDAAEYVRPYSKGQKNDFRDAEAIAEAVQRPTMKFVATKTAEQLDLQALHRVRERLVSQRTGIIKQIRAFLLERGVTLDKVPASCAGNCRTSSPSALMCCRLA
jgi:uncharacterized iron-regulated protein